MQKKIHLVSPMWPSKKHPNYGVFVKNICDGLVKEGWEVDTSKKITNRGITVVKKLINHFSLLKNILRLILKKPKLIYVHAPSWFTFLIWGISRCIDTKLVFHLHGSEILSEKLFVRLSRKLTVWCIKRSELIVVPSQFFKKRIVENFYISESLILVSPSGGINRKIFQPMKCLSIRNRINVPREAKIIGFVGLSRDKGSDTFLKILEKNTSLWGLFIGKIIDDEYSFEMRVTQLGLNDRLIILEILPQSELAQAFNCMDLLIAPTRFEETLGLTMLEAMSCGTPVIGSNSGALPEYILPEKTGYLCDPESVSEFCESISSYFRLDRRKQQNIQKNCRTMADNFDSDRAQKFLSSTFTSLIQDN